MTDPTPGPGPDLVIAGAARSGTSSLAAQLGHHPDIDAGKVKEPNYFSRHLDRGAEWYEGLYLPRRDGLFRLDASTSYASPLYPDAPARLAAAAPDCLVIYAVRQPTERALSHYLLRHFYFHIDPARDFGAALAGDSFYVEGSDYSRWIPELRKVFPEQQVLVVPFELITERPQEVTAQVCRLLGLPDPPAAEHRGRRHRNNVVEYRHEAARQAARAFRRSAAYPMLRSLLGPGRMRTARRAITREAELPSEDKALASCTAEQLAMLRSLDERAGAATMEHLAAQDARLGIAWSGLSFAANAV